jgi:methylated-DNA-[protein]-cysteine S-methyltransferase
MLFQTEIKTPLGVMLAGCDAEGICLFDFAYRKSIHKIVSRIESVSGELWSDGYMPIFDLLQEQIAAYFDGALQNFSLPLSLKGTPFQISVWKGLLQIPYGETRSYLQQAQLLGNEKAVRAVAAANGENGIAIIVPCHRVVGTNGSLTGYGGGIQKKAWLLRHEKKYAGNAQQSALFPD